MIKAVRSKKFQYDFQIALNSLCFGVLTYKSGNPKPAKINLLLKLELNYER